MVGNNVSHSKRRTRRKFYPNFNQELKKYRKAILTILIKVK